MQQSITLTLLVMGLLLGCNNNSSKYQEIDVKTLDYDETQKVFAKHLHLEGQNYVLKLSLQEAINLGVAEEEYYGFIKELEQGNQNTQECLEKGIGITLSNPQEDLLEMEKNNISSPEGNTQKIFAEYLFLDGQNYVLKLSLEEAINLGISEEKYKAFVKSLEEGNRHTQECLKQGIGVTISDPQEDLARIRQENIRVKTKAESVAWEDRFYKSVILPDRINHSIFITKIYYRVDVTCACNAAFWWIIVRDEAAGNTSPSHHKFTGSLYSTPTFQFKIITTPLPLVGGWRCIGTKGAGNGATATVRFSSKIKTIDGQAVFYD